MNDLLNNQSGNTVVAAMALLIAAMAFTSAILLLVENESTMVTREIDDQQSFILNEFVQNLAEMANNRVPLNDGQSANFPPFLIDGLSDSGVSIYSKTFECQLTASKTIDVDPSTGSPLTVTQFRVDSYREKYNDDRRLNRVNSRRSINYQTYAGFLWFADCNVPLAGGYPHTGNGPRLDHIDNYFYKKDIFSGPVATNSPLVVRRSTASPAGFNDGWPVFLDYVRIGYDEKLHLGPLDQYRGEMVKKESYNQEADYFDVDPEEVMEGIYNNDDLKKILRDPVVRENEKALEYPELAKEVRSSPGVRMPGESANVDVYWVKLDGSTAYYLRGFVEDTLSEAQHQFVDRLGKVELDSLNNWIEARDENNNQFPDLDTTYFAYNQINSADTYPRVYGNGQANRPIEDWICATPYHKIRWYGHPANWYPPEDWDPNDVGAESFTLPNHNSVWVGCDLWISCIGGLTTDVTFGAQGHIRIMGDLWYEGYPPSSLPSGSTEDDPPGGLLGYLMQEGDYFIPNSVPYYLGLVSEKNVTIAYTEENKDGDVYIFAGLCALGYDGDAANITYKDGQFTFEFQHPLPRTLNNDGDLLRANPYAGGLVSNLLVDLDKDSNSNFSLADFDAIFDPNNPQDRVSVYSFPYYNLFGQARANNIYGNSTTTGPTWPDNSQQSINVLAQEVNPPVPEFSNYLKPVPYPYNNSSRGTMHVYGSIAQRVRGHSRRQTKATNDDFWPNVYHKSTVDAMNPGYSRDLCYDDRFREKAPPDYPETYTAEGRTSEQKTKFEIIIPTD